MNSEKGGIGVPHRMSMELENLQRKCNFLYKSASLAV